MTVLSRTPLGLKILIHKPGRLAVSIAGIALAVVLMFTQDGFREAMFDSQTETIRRLDGDLFLVNRLKYLLNGPEPFPAFRLTQARAVQGIASVEPLYLEMTRSLWKNPGDPVGRPIRVLAFNPDHPAFTIADWPRLAEDLKQPDTVLFDQRSRSAFGNPQRGSEVELAGHRVFVVGTFALGTDFLTDGTLLMSERNFLHYFGGAKDKIEIGIIRLAPGADLLAVQRELVQALPTDVSVLTKKELAALELRYWQSNAAIGYVFTLGMVVGFVIGTVVCYQILYANVSSLLPQFATLKAMGFTNGYLVTVVFQQGLFLALLGFVPAVLAAQGLFLVLGQLTGLIMVLTPFRIGLILVLTVVMCLLSGVVAMRRVMTADPAEVFR